MKHVKLFEQFLSESAFDAILKYVDNPYGIGADSAEFDQVGRDRQIVFRFADKRDREATRENLKELGIQGKKMSDVNAEKGYAYPYELIVFESVELSINEAKGDKITIHWSGLPVGPKGTIGTFIVSPKVHDQIEDEMGRSISIDFEDENVTGKLASFNDVMDSIKKSDYGKLAFSESIEEAIDGHANVKVGDTVKVKTSIAGKKELTGKIEKMSPFKIRTDASSTIIIPNSAITSIELLESSVNEAYNRWYIETWYDQDGRKVQLLGSDGTTVTKRPPFDGDVENHHDRITKLRKIKPFLVGDVEYRVVDGQGRVLKTYDKVIEESLNTHD